MKPLITALLLWAVASCTSASAGVVGSFDNPVGGSVTILDTSTSACQALASRYHRPFFDAVVTAKDEAPERGCWTFLGNGEAVGVIWDGGDRSVYPVEDFPSIQKK